MDGFEEGCCGVVFVLESDNNLTKLTFNEAQSSAGFPRRSIFNNPGIFFFKTETSMLDKLLNISSKTLTHP